MADREPRDGVGQRVADVHGVIPLRATGFARKGNLRQNSVSTYLRYWPNISQMCNCCCGDDVMLEAGMDHTEEPQITSSTRGEFDERSALCIGMR